MKNRSDLPEQTSYSRRTLLKRTVVLGATGLLAPALLAGCSGDNTTTSQNVTASCDDDLGLAARATRRALNYVAESPHADQTCANCQFYKTEGDVPSCGGCEIVSGPIAPEAYCDSWAIVEG